MPPRRKFAVVPPGTRERTRDLREVVKAALVAMDWLTDSDEAMKTLALRMAEEIEKTIDRAEELDAVYLEFRGASGGTDAFKRMERLQALCDVTKTVSMLGPQLQSVLRDLGGTPAVRKAILGKTANKGGRLAAMQEAAQGAFDGEEEADVDVDVDIDDDDE